jgi:hypothetical protein
MPPPTPPAAQSLSGHKNGGSFPRQDSGGRSTAYKVIKNPIVGQDMGIATMHLERIRQFVARLAPLPVCEECVGEHVPDIMAQEVHLSLSELAVERGFDRARALCGLCGHERLVVEKTRTVT